MAAVSVCATSQTTGDQVVYRVRDGSIIVRFDKTPPPVAGEDVVCPHFLELKWATGCPFSCAWCYLQGTFRLLPYRTTPRFKDVRKLEDHLLEFWHSESRPELLNAGELSDALMGERNGHSLVRRLDAILPEGGPHRVLLLTKSNWIENLLHCDRPDLFVVSLSVNAQTVAERWEKKAPSPAQRLVAAERLARAGYEVRLRIDPIIPVADWRRHYRDLIGAIADRFVPERITLGSLRGLQSTINNSRDRSWVEYATEKSRWGRRVPAGARLELFRELAGMIAQDLGSIPVALCKEPVEIWDAAGMDWRSPTCNCVW